MPATADLLTPYRWATSEPSGWLPDGWVVLFVTMLCEIDAIAGEVPDLRVHIIEAKEKFGTLRLYYRLPDDLAEGPRQRIRAAIEAAEAQSGRTCDVCGQVGRLHYHGGVRATRCDAHVDRYKRSSPSRNRRRTRHDGVAEDTEPPEGPETKSAEPSEDDGRGEHALSAGPRPMEMPSTIPSPTPTRESSARPARGCASSSPGARRDDGATSRARPRTRSPALKPWARRRPTCAR